MKVSYRHSRCQPHSRRGFTLIELLVVISIIAVLAALITPAVQSARRAARNLECKNNLSNLGKALANFESGTGYLPYFYETATGSWIYQLLPYLDAGAIHEQLQAGTVTADTIYLKVLACPDDETALKVDGQTSYVANVGYIEKTLWNTPGENLGDPALTHSPNNPVYNWDGANGPPVISNADIKTSLAAGVFHRPSGSRRMSSQLINSGDGNQFTIWATENVQATNWYGAHVRECGFGADVDVAAFVTATGTSFKDLTLVNPSNGANVGLGAIDLHSMSNREISASTTVDGQFPRPSSRHTGTINVLYADGRVQSMSESINSAVYFSLLTSEGTRNGQGVIDDSVF